MPDSLEEIRRDLTDTFERHQIVRKVSAMKVINPLRVVSTIQSSDAIYQVP